MCFALAQSSSLGLGDFFAMLQCCNAAMWGYKFYSRIGYSYSLTTILDPSQYAAKGWLKDRYLWFLKMTEMLDATNQSDYAGWWIDMLKPTLN